LLALSGRGQRIDIARGAVWADGREALEPADDRCRRRGVGNGVLGMAFEQPLHRPVLILVDETRQRREIGRGPGAGQVEPIDQLGQQRKARLLRRLPRVVPLTVVDIGDRGPRGLKLAIGEGPGGRCAGEGRQRQGRDRRHDDAGRRLAVG